MLSDATIEGLLQGTTADNLNSKCDALIDETLASGAHDNVTVVLALFQ